MVRNQEKPEGEAQIGFLEKLMRLFIRRRLPVPVNGPLPVIATPETIPFSIGVAQIEGDLDDNAYRRNIFEQMEGRTGIRLKALDKTIRIEEGSDPLVPHSAAMNARYLAAEENVDVVLWGQVVMDSLRLHFSPAGSPDEEKPGCFTVYNRLFMPLSFDDGYSDFLFMALLASAEAVVAPHHMALRQLLPPAIEAVEGWMNNPPYDLQEDQQRDYWVCYAHAHAALGNQDTENSSAWYDKAIALYEKALETPVSHENPAEIAQIRRHIAIIQLARAEFSEDPADLEIAVAALHSILDTLTRGSNPQEWANTQNRLGLLLYKLDLKTGKTEPLKEAILAFQAALQVYTRYEYPQRWADIMHNLAQALEVYGDQLKNPDVLDRAIDTCRLSLEVRNRDGMPLTWAATMNTLGAALFLKDKHTQNSTLNLDEAAQCLQAAIEVFTAHRAEQWKEIALKNLEHVAALLNLRRSRRVVEPNWVGVGKYDPTWLPSPELDADEIRHAGNGEGVGKGDAEEEEGATPLLTGPSALKTEKEK